MVCPDGTVPGRECVCCWETWTPRGDPGACGSSPVLSSLAETLERAFAFRCQWPRNARRDLLISYSSLRKLGRIEANAVKAEMCICIANNKIFLKLNLVDHFSFFCLKR